MSDIATKAPAADHVITEFTLDYEVSPGKKLRDCNKKDLQKMAAFMLALAGDGAA